MKILFFIDSLCAGGKERRLVELLKILSQQKDIHSEVVVMEREIHYKEIFNLNLKIHYLIRKYKKDPSILFKLYNLCKENRPDIIHCWGTMPAIYAIPISKLLKIKTINSIITSAPTKLNMKQFIHSRLLYPFSDIILSNSLAGLKAYSAPSHKSKCIYNGFNFERCNNLDSPDSVRIKFNISTKYVVGMVGAFEDRKDYHTFISTALEIVKKRKDVSFIAVGGGTNLEKFRSMVPVNLHRRIIFTGKQSNIESIVNIFDIGILVSEQDVHGEGISNSILEYMAFCKPVIATSGGGNAEIILDDTTGYLITQNNIRQLIEKIEYLLSNDEKRVDMGTSGAQRVKDVFGIDKMIYNFTKLYNEV
jgi:glycosyltransferase involved in cell wall biosynthesis